MSSQATGPGIEPFSALDQNLIKRVNVGDALTRSADLHGDRPALIEADREISYRELDARANRLGHALLGLGLEHQDVVGLMARNTSEFLITYFACAKAGLICAPVNLALSGQEIAYCLNDAQAKILIVEEALAQAAGALPAALPALTHVYWTGDDPHTDIAKSAGTFDDLVNSGRDDELEIEIADRDVLQLLYTSGTTAAPKGVMTSHLAVTLTALSAALTAHMGTRETTLVHLPLFHCAMLNSMLLPLITIGGTAVLMTEFDATRAAKLIEQHKVTITVMLPMMYGELLALPDAGTRDFASVTRAVYAMAPMPEARLKAIHDLFPNADVVLGSGQTEFTPPTCFQQPEHQWSKAASWGTATAMTRVAIMDEEGHLLPRGEIGEIVYRGPQVMNGYLNLPDKTAESFAHGWFHSGDVAWMDEDGAIWFTDRKKDVIKTGGENVASIEIERCLMEHADVAEAAVVGVAHERWGEAITAMVIRKPGTDVDEHTLIAHCRERLSGFKVPKAIVFTEAFPRTGTGKIQKHIMRTQLQNE